MKESFVRLRRFQGYLEDFQSVAEGPSFMFEELDFVTFGWPGPMGPREINFVATEEAGYYSASAKAEQ